jgi:hypothetical protein
MFIYVCWKSPIGEGLLETAQKFKSCGEHPELRAARRRHWQRQANQRCSAPARCTRYWACCTGLPASRKRRGTPDGAPDWPVSKGNMLMGGRDSSTFPHEANLQCHGCFVLCSGQQLTSAAGCLWSEMWGMPSACERLITVASVGRRCQTSETTDRRCWDVYSRHVERGSGSSSAFQRPLPHSSREAPGLRLQRPQERKLHQFARGGEKQAARSSCTSCRRRSPKAFCSLHAWLHCCQSKHREFARSGLLRLIEGNLNW